MFCPVAALRAPNALELHLGSADQRECARRAVGSAFENRLFSSLDVLAVESSLGWFRWECRHVSMMWAGFPCIRCGVSVSVLDLFVSGLSSPYRDGVFTWFGAGSERRICYVLGRGELLGIQYVYGESVLRSRSPPLAFSLPISCQGVDFSQFVDHLLLPLPNSLLSKVDQIRSCAKNHRHPIQSQSLPWYPHPASSQKRT